MKIVEILETMLMTFYFAKVIEAADSDGNKIKWFLLNKYLYHIDVEQEYSAHAAQQFCIDNDMFNIIQSSELIVISKLLINIFANNPSFWILDEDEGSSFRNCYALAINGVYSAQCESLKGVLCKTEIYGGSLQYKNGTQLEVDVDGVNRLCNPNQNKYDELLEYCLIKFYKQLL